MDCQQHHTESEQRKVDFHTRGEAAPVRRGCLCKDPTECCARSSYTTQCSRLQWSNWRKAAAAHDGLNVSRQLGVFEGVGANKIAARVSLRHVGVAVDGGSSARGDMGQAAASASSRLPGACMIAKALGVNSSSDAADAIRTKVAR